MSKQILGLELLRGGCAVLVALYHLLSWSNLAHPYGWGLYGVYIFFVISGAVLYHNYHGAFQLGLSSGEFLLKRFARLAPLYIACVLATAIIHRTWPLGHIVLNATLLFGFVNPGTTSTVTGGWSLGIEFVLYVIFPVLLYFARSWTTAIATLAVLFVLRVVFCEVVLGERTLVEVWSNYTQVGSFMVFFFGGMLLAKLMHEAPPNRAAAASLGLASLLLLLLFPGHTAERVITGPAGMLYTVLALTSVAGFFWSPRNVVMVAISKFLGDVSYGLYLIHPLAWVVLGALLPGVPTPMRVALTIVSSAIGAWLALRIYEKPMKRWIMARSLGSVRGVAERLR